MQKTISSKICIIKKLKTEIRKHSNLPGGVCALGVQCRVSRFRELEQYIEKVM